MSPRRLVSILIIFALATVAWFTLGATLSYRSTAAASQLGEEVRQVWGPGLTQPHLTLLADGGTFPDTQSQSQDAVQPAASRLEVKLHYTPKKRGLVWHRTYEVAFRAEYDIVNASSSARNIRIQLTLPSKETGYDNFVFKLGDDAAREVLPHDGKIETVAMVPAGATLPLIVGYEARGLDRWTYAFPQNARVKNFTLNLTTNFDDISFPASASSPADRTRLSPEQGGWALLWEYKDAIDARDIALDMPTVLNAGPVVARITFFAPVSLALFFGVLVVTGMLRGINLHPMTYAFLAAGFFTFHLLLAYLGGLFNLHVSFAIAAATSLLLVCGYLHAVAGARLSVVATIAQLAYMVLFSYSFFFDGLTGITLTVSAVVTLALLMMATAKVDWETAFQEPNTLWGRPQGYGA
ncbi:MAG: inner membrane CreD family protein [Verrucomicrobium sp.]